MCVGLSARVVSIEDGTALIDDLEPGDYVMVHAGVAIAKITDTDADESRKLMESLDGNGETDH